MIETNFARSSSMNGQIGQHWIWMGEGPMSDEAWKVLTTTSTAAVPPIAIKIPTIVITIPEMPTVVIEQPRPTFWQRVWTVLNTDVRVLWARWRNR